MIFIPVCGKIILEEDLFSKFSSFTERSNNFEINISHWVFHVGKEKLCASLFNSHFENISGVDVICPKCMKFFLKSAFYWV